METLLERIRKVLAEIEMARKEKPQDSSRKPPIKIDHEFVATKELEGFWSSAIFQGSPILYDGHSLFDLENSEKLEEFKSLDNTC